MTPALSLPPVPPATLPMVEDPKTRRTHWLSEEVSAGRELAEVVAVITVLTIGGWFMPVGHDVLGHVYLLTVIMLSLRVSRWSALFAAVASGLVWNYTFVPPRLEFSKLGLNDGLLLGSYFMVALSAGQLTTHIRRRQRTEQQRERRATALFHLTRALATARSLDEGIAAALRQADDLFEARSALLLVDEQRALQAHPAGSLPLDDAARRLAAWVQRNRHEGGRFTDVSPEAPAQHLPLLRGERVLGVLVIRPPAHAMRAHPHQQELLEAFAAQLALLVEREALREADERARLLAGSARLQRTLLDSVAHELRTPLAVMQTAAEQLARAHDDPQRAQLPREILTATRRLNRLVSNLLGQTRLEAGMVKANLDWCDSRDIIATARRDLGEALAHHRLQIALPTDLPLLRADAPLLEQVLANLLLNAVRYSPPGSTVTISGGVDPDRSNIVITVTDEGAGIPANLRANLFRKFQRGDALRTDGVGLGLSIVRGFMQAQGGTVTLEETPPGGGARLSIRLPHVPHGNVPSD